MQVTAFPSGPISTNAYIVSCSSTREAAIIDPAAESADVLMDYLKTKKLIPKMILLTHSHWDHIADVAKLVTALHLPVYVHGADAGNMQDPGSDGLPLFFAINGVTPTGLLEDGEQISLGKLAFTVIHTPGHSPGSVGFYEPTQGVLMSGDTLFKGTIGNLALPTANSSAMWPSLSKLAKLPPATKVYPGHGDSTTIGAEHWLPRAREYFGD